MKWIIVMGDPIEGFRFIGSFKTEAKAKEHANLWITDYETYWTAALHPKED